MNRRNKQLLAILLVMTAAVGLMSVGVYAQETATELEWPEIVLPESEQIEITVPEFLGPVEILMPAQPLRPEGSAIRKEAEPEDSPEEEIPLVENPEEISPGNAEEISAETEIPEEVVPLAAVPETGDSTLLYALAAAISGTGLIRVGRKKN